MASPSTYDLSTLPMSCSLNGEGSSGEYVYLGYGEEMSDSLRKALDNAPPRKERPDHPDNIIAVYGEAKVIAKAAGKLALKACTIL